MKKIINPGKAEDGEVFVEITYENNRLTLHGVVGPKRNGNCSGPCGQIVDIEIKEFSPGWTPEMWEKVKCIWNLYHLNDMQPGCEHQRELGWGKTELTVVTWRLKQHIVSARHKTKEDVWKRLTAGETITLTEEERKMAEMHYEVKTGKGYESDYTKANYDLVKEETRTDGWFTPSNHPLGNLSRPCPVCGYRFGSKWLSRPVPDDVIQALQSLPDSVTEPAWV
jgi:hypothetical protein